MISVPACLRPKARTQTLHTFHLQKQNPNDVALFVCRGEGRKSVIEPFTTYGELYEEADIKAALESPTEEGLFYEMMIRGWLGG